MENIKRMTWKEFCDRMWGYNEMFPECQENSNLQGVIVYKACNWDFPYSETDRSYRVSNANRMFQPGKISNSLFGDCLDGRDVGVRLDWYNWEVDYCYFC